MDPEAHSAPLKLVSSSSSGDQQHFDADEHSKLVLEAMRHLADQQLEQAERVRSAARQTFVYLAGFFTLAQAAAFTGFAKESVTPWDTSATSAQPARNSGNLESPAQDYNPGLTLTTSMLGEPKIAAQAATPDELAAWPLSRKHRAVSWPPDRIVATSALQIEPDAYALAIIRALRLFGLHGSPPPAFFAPGPGRDWREQPTDVTMADHIFAVASPGQDQRVNDAGHGSKAS